MSDGVYDLIVVGGGMGGLATAALAQRLGLRTALLESHTKVGGCAGYFQRGPYTFDAGATALMGLDPGEPIGDLAALLEIEIASVPTNAYRVHLPDHVVDIGPDDALFEDEVVRALDAQGRAAAGVRRFWRIQQAIGRTLFEKSARIPRLPLGSAADLVHNLRILGLPGILAGATSLITVDRLIGALGLGDDQRLRALVGMLLEDTAQAALGQALPLAPSALVHAEFATPQAFARYTRRVAGAVGGPAASRTNTNFFAVGPDALGPGLFLVGDSVFPGQGTMAVVVSAIRAVECLTGLTWDRIDRGTWKPNRPAFVAPGVQTRQTT